jgi:hypothetical protein
LNSKSIVAAYGLINGSNLYHQLHIDAPDTVVGTFPLLGAEWWVKVPSFGETVHCVATCSTITYTDFPAFPGNVIGSYSINFIGLFSGHLYIANGTFKVPRKN